MRHLHQPSFTPSGVIMRNLFIAAAIITTSFTAVADGEPYANPQVASSGITREQVMNEANRAAARGAIVSGEGQSVNGMRAPAASHTPPPPSRAEVRAQLDLARRNGELSSGEFRSAPDTRSNTGM